MIFSSRGQIVNLTMFNPNRCYFRYVVLALEKVVMLPEDYLTKTQFSIKIFNVNGNYSCAQE